MIDEESTAWPGVTQAPSEGGLGFSHKWNMGWMNDTLRYISRDPLYRSHHHNDLTFSLIYSFSERFILPLSHDEVVHGKGSILARMPGDDWRRFASMRAYLAFMWSHPGKKMIFMGIEFAQQAEWNHDKELDWFLLDVPNHRSMQLLVRDLNQLYRDLPPLHRLDHEPAGFSWLVGDDHENSVIAFLRHAEDERPLLSISNFTPVPRQHYRVGVPNAGKWQEILNSDSHIYGGSKLGNNGELTTQPVCPQCHPLSRSLTLPPPAATYFTTD